MHGIDITSISRFKSKIKKDELVKRILSKDELILFNQLKEKKKKTYFLAVRFSIKESFFKASQTSLNMNQVTIIKNNNKYKINNYDNYDVSNSKEKDILITSVIKKGNKKIWKR